MNRQEKSLIKSSLSVFAVNVMLTSVITGAGDLRSTNLDMSSNDSQLKTVFPLMIFVVYELLAGWAGHRSYKNQSTTALFENAKVRQEFLCEGRTWRLLFGNLLCVLINPCLSEKKNLKRDTAKPCSRLLFVTPQLLWIHHPCVLLSCDPFESKRMKRLACEETVIRSRWGGKTRRLGIKRVDKDQIKAMRG